jgi:hypothetical protein
MKEKRIKNFGDFINEGQFTLRNPDVDGDKFAKILSLNRNVKEDPKGSNRGEMVSAYLASTGLGSGYPWCMAFVYYVFNELSKQLGQTNPLPKTAGVMDHWGKATKDEKITIDQARQDPNLVRPGQIFIMSRPGKGLGHTGIVIGVDPQKKTFTTIEGNTNDQQSGEGDRVGVNVRRLDSKTLIGFIDYFRKSRTKEFEMDLIKGAKGVSGALGPIPTTPLPDSTSMPSSSVVGSQFDKAARGKTITQSIFGGLAKVVSGKELDLSPSEIQSVLTKLK